jgi:hypothetical protein
MPAERQVQSLEDQSFELLPEATVLLMPVLEHQIHKGSCFHHLETGYKRTGIYPLNLHRIKVCVSILYRK